MLFPPDRSHSPARVSEGLGRLWLALAIVGGIALMIGLYLRAGGDLRRLADRFDQLQGMGSETEIDGSDSPLLSASLKELLADAEATIQNITKQEGIAYRAAIKTTFQQGIESPCHGHQMVAGTFYCFKDETLYIDPDYFRELVKSSVEGGEMAQAYVVGRLMGKHLLTLRGITDRIQAREMDMKPFERTKLDRQADLAADYFAGIWASRSPVVRQIYESSSMEAAFEGIKRTDQATLEKTVLEGAVLVERFDGASPTERLQWFRKGFELGDGDPLANDPFSSKEP